MEKEYVLGTHDEEIERLGLQHRVWRPRMLDAWRRAGFTSGQALLDVGCGPGYASIDLAEITGSGGIVHAIDRSGRFLHVLDLACQRHSLKNIRTYEVDLNEAALPEVFVDGAWARWVLAFVKHPRAVLADMVRCVKPGGTLVIHEYFDYSIWQLSPKTVEVEEFLGEVMKNWRVEGGEPNIGLDVPRWLAELGCRVRSLNPIVDVVSPDSYTWQWPKTFLQIGVRRLVDLGRVTPERAQKIQLAFDEREQDPRTLIFTPGVLEIIAMRE
jgi:SAM-dependent methyltransferase